MANITAEAPRLLAPQEFLWYFPVVQGGKRLFGGLSTDEVGENHETRTRSSKGMWGLSVGPTTHIGKPLSSEKPTQCLGYRTDYMD
ncbi:hypothetical protein J6590_033090 [Homalodisca vitripennis]|nr:hypothetical protein J6590_033090 [Homalodisca vitripennis]